MKQFALIILSVACSLLLFSCKREEDKGKMVFHYNQIGGMESLDPAFAKNLSIMWGVHFIYNTLLEVDSQAQVIPSLARGWIVSPDGLRYTFNLRTDVFFQDNDAFPGGKGRRMTAGDVVYSFNRIIDPATASAGAWVFNDRVRSAEPFVALNDSTFVIYLRVPFRPLPGMLSMPYCSVVPEEVVRRWGKDFRSHPCGTGPFIFRYWDEGNVLVLHRNPAYWEKDERGKALPYLDAVKVSFHETRALEFLLFNQGKLDFINGIDGSMKDMILTKKGELKSEFAKEIRLQKNLYLNTEYLGIILDTLHPMLQGNPLRIKKIRQAMNYAIDRQKIVTYFRNGVGIAATKGFTPPGVPGVEGGPERGYSYNPDRALGLLQEAGFPEGKGLPEIILTTPDAYADICNFVASQLNEVGIPVKVQVMMQGLLRQLMVKSEVAFYKASWIADYPDAESFLACFYSPFPAPPNYTRFQHTTFDQWYRQSLQADDDSLRFLLYGKMDSLVSAEAPVIPLFYDEMLHFTRRSVSGFHRNPLNIIDLKRVSKD